MAEKFQNGELQEDVRQKLNRNAEESDNIKGDVSSIKQQYIKNGVNGTSPETAGGIKNTSPGPLDKNRGPYISVADANAAIPNVVVGGRNLREGKFVEIGIAPNLVTYWWKGGYANSNLVEYFGELTKSSEFIPIKVAVNDTTVASFQLSDNIHMFESGGYSPVNGSAFDSNNQIRSKNLTVESSWKGQRMTISGFGVLLPTGGARVVIRNSANENLLLIPGAGTDNTPVTFLIPIDAAYVRFGIANILDIGLKPTENVFVDSFMVNLGSTALPAEKYGTKVKYTRVDYPMKERDQEIEKRINPVILDSVNVINFVTDFEAGGYATSNGNKVNTNNQIRVKMLPVLDAWKNKQMTLSGFGVLNPTGGARVVIRDLQNVVLLIIPGAGTDYTPVTFSIPATASTIGFGIANILNIGLKPTENVFTGSLQFEIGNVAHSFDKYGVSSVNLANAKNWPQNLGGFDETEIILSKPSANFMTIYFHTGKKAANDIWFGVDFVRAVKPVSPESSTSNYDTWKLNIANRFKRSSETAFSVIEQVVLTGVWENAIYTDSSVTGYRNALGSLHGNELMEEVTFLIDGIEMLASFEGDKKCKSVIITQRSHFTRQDSTTDFVGISLKRWDIAKGVITISNQINWLAILPILRTSYLSMCSIIRKSSSGIQITHTAIRDDEYKKYDVSEAGFSNPLNSIQDNPNNKMMTIWGDNFSVDFRIIERRPALPDAGLWIQNTELYNKGYGPFGSATVKNGDVWFVAFSVTPFVN